MARLPQVSARELIRFLRSRGFVPRRQRGSHLTLWHEERRVAVTIPVHTGCDLGRGLVVRILRAAGFSVDDYLRLRQCDPRPDRALTRGDEVAGGPTGGVLRVGSSGCPVPPPPADSGPQVRLPPHAGIPAQLQRRLADGGAGGAVVVAVQPEPAEREGVHLVPLPRVRRAAVAILDPRGATAEVEHFGVFLDERAVRWVPVPLA